MLVPGETLLFSPRGMVTATALKWSGPSVTVGNLVAAITVRVIADVSQVTYGTDYPYFPLDQNKNLDKLGLSGADVKAIESSRCER